MFTKGGVVALTIAVRTTDIGAREGASVGHPRLPDERQKHNRDYGQDIRQR